MLVTAPMGAILDSIGGIAAVYVLKHYTALSSSCGALLWIYVVSAQQQQLSGFTFHRQSDSNFFIVYDTLLFISHHISGSANGNTDSWYALPKPWQQSQRSGVSVVEFDHHYYKSVCTIRSTVWEVVQTDCAERGSIQLDAFCGTPWKMLSVTMVKATPNRKPSADWNTANNASTIIIVRCETKMGNKWKIVNREG